MATTTSQLLQEHSSKSCVTSLFPYGSKSVQRTSSMATDISFAFSTLAENSAHEGPYMAMRLNEQRFETSTGGYEHEQIIMQGGKPKRDAWIHVLYRQQGHKGELFLDGKLIGRNDQMPILAEIFKEAPANCWIGRAPFRGDKYLTQTDVADLRIYNYAVSNQELKQLKQGFDNMKY